jgi:hypothetical protein
MDELFVALFYLLALGLAITMIIAQWRLFAIKRTLDEMLFLAQHEHKVGCESCRTRSLPIVG